MNRILKSLFLLSLCLTASSAQAKNYTFLVDRSGSVAGLSKVRSTNSIQFIQDELQSFLASSLVDDRIFLVGFTENIIDSIEGNPQSEEIVRYITNLTPQKGNSDIINALQTIRRQRPQSTITIISDGFQNIGDSIETARYIDDLSSESLQDVYFLILNPQDVNSSIATGFSNYKNLKVIHSLSEIDRAQSAENATPNDTTSHVMQAVVSDANNILSQSNNSIDWSKWAMWMLLTLLAGLIIGLIAYCIIYISPAFSQTSIASLNILVFKLFSLPEWLFNLILKIVPKNFASYMKKNMPSYGNFKKGDVIADNDTQRELLDKHYEITGKRLKYKNDQPDFSDIAEYEQKLPGGLSAHVDGADPRKSVFKAQEKAGNLMLQDSKGRKIIHDYLKSNGVDKDIADIDFNDYTSWKDDSYNFGKPNHNPKTPHESIDGTRIQYVSTKFHDGFRHTGGVSMLKSLRQCFPKAV